MVRQVCYCVLLCALSHITLASDRARDYYTQGMQHYDGVNQPQSYQAAHRMMLDSANLGYGPAQLQLGLHFSRGHGVKQNRRLAMRWLKQAAEQHILGSHHYIAQFYQYGHGVAIDPARALWWYARSAELGYRDSLDSLSKLSLENGLGAWRSADDLLERNASDGDTVSQYNLGYSYYIGHQRDQDLTKAVVWFLKAATQGEADSQAMLTKMYALGEGVKQSDYYCYFWGKAALEESSSDIEGHFNKCKSELSAEDIRLADLAYQKSDLGSNFID